jgi:hypothetical protein
MRFSAAFTLPLPQLAPVTAQAGLLAPARRPAVAEEPVPAPARELPLDLDQRVRESGEW